LRQYISFGSFGAIHDKDLSRENTLFLTLSRMARGHEVTVSALEKLKNWSSHLQDSHAMRVMVKGMPELEKPTECSSYQM
jgi:hypothetical protein